MKVGAILAGKMSYLALCNPLIKVESQARGLNFIYLRGATQALKEHDIYDIEALNSVLIKNSMFKFLRTVRRFSVSNDSIDLKLRQFIVDNIYKNKSISNILVRSFGFEITRNIPKIGKLARKIEENVF
jgi:hypothetical protein